MLTIDHNFVDWCHMAVLALSLGYLVYELGVISLGHAGAVLVGGYAMALWQQERLSAPVVLITVAFVVFLVAATALRLREDVFALVTLGQAQALHYAAKGWDTLTEGPLGLRVERTDWMASDEGGALVGATILAVTVTAYLWVQYSRLGPRCGAVRDNELAATTIGIDVGRTRLVAVTVAVLLATIVGVAKASNKGLVTPSYGLLTVSLQVLAATLIARPFWRHGQPWRAVVGTLLGAALIVALPVWLRVWFADTGDDSYLPAWLRIDDEAVLRNLLFGLVLYVLMLVHGIRRSFEREGS